MLHDEVEEGGEFAGVDEGNEGEDGGEGVEVEHHDDGGDSVWVCGCVGV